MGAQAVADALRGLGAAVDVLWAVPEGSPAPPGAGDAGMYNRMYDGEKHTAPPGGGDGGMPNRVGGGDGGTHDRVGGAFFALVSSQLLPAAALLARGGVALVVCHCGPALAQEALAGGAPLLCLPLSGAWVWRLREFGWGVSCVV